MNKKLLLIFSILLISLSLFSCAKSVAAPDTLEQMSTITLADELRTIKGVEDSNNNTVFDFSTGRLDYNTQNPWVFTVETSGNANLNTILTSLKNALSAHNDNIGMIFTPEENWDFTDYTTADLIVHVDSYTHIIPENFEGKTIKIHLKANSWVQ